jgi:hypothetical protein
MEMGIIIRLGAGNLRLKSKGIPAQKFVDFHLFLPFHLPFENVDVTICATYAQECFLVGIPNPDA